MLLLFFVVAVACVVVIAVVGGISVGVFGPLFVVATVFDDVWLLILAVVGVALVVVGDFVAVFDDDIFVIVNVYVFRLCK